MFLFHFNFAFSQVPFDSLFNHPTRTIQGPKGVFTDIEADEEGNIYLLETAKHKIHKIFAARGYDSILTVGGKGTGEEGFNMPTKISLPNRQNLYLLDWMNRRIAVLNTNLRVVDDINFLNIDINLLDENQEYLNPLSFAASPSGDLFFLNQEDLKIYKFQNSGQVQTVFGGLDYGDGSLANPDDITINKDNSIFVSDTTLQMISVFDLFGIFQYKLMPRTDFRWSRMVTYENYLILMNGSDLFFMNTVTKKVNQIHLSNNQKVMDVTGTRENLILLTNKEIQLFKLF